MRDTKLLEKIGALLRQAEGTDNEHEAQAFMQAAQRLATASAIDLAMARSHESRAQRSTPIMRQVTIGEAGKRGLRTYVQLYIAIAQANDITCDVARNSTFVYAYGFTSDLDAVAALYVSLVLQMVAASDAYLKMGEYKQETALVQEVGRRGYVRKSLSPMTARINFQAAFAERIGIRLTEARDEAKAEVLARTPKSTALALRDKEIEVRDFHKNTSTARGLWRPSVSGAGYSDAARAAGDSAGRRAKLQRDKEFGSSVGSLTR